MVASFDTTGADLPVESSGRVRSAWPPPPAVDLPTGSELVDRYLDPLARHPAIAPHLRLGHRVTAVARDGIDKVREPGRRPRRRVTTVSPPTGIERR
jgi:hypothetical protein